MLFTREQPSLHHTQDTGRDTPEQHGWHTGIREAIAQNYFADSLYAMCLPKPCGGCLYEDESSRECLGGHPVGELGNDPSQSLPPVGLALQGGEAADRALDDQIASREEALVLPLEVLVKGPSRNAGDLGEPPNGDGFVALAAGQLDHSGLQASPLVRLDFDGRHPRPGT